MDADGQPEPLQAGKEIEEACIECPLCLEEYIEGDTIKLLRCGHYFHVGCYDELREYKGRKLRCPNCNSRVYRKKWDDPPDKIKCHDLNNFVTFRRFREISHLEGDEEIEEVEEDIVSVSLNEDENPAYAIPFTFCGEEVGLLESGRQGSVEVAT